MGEYEIMVALSARDAPHAVEAATRLSTGSRLQVRVVGDAVVITGADGESDARHRWRVALLNERLVAEADPRRTDILKSLVE